MTREALSSIDRAWLRMEDPTRPMMNTILLVFDAPLEFERLQVLFRRRLLRFPRLRQRVSQPPEAGGAPAWEDDPAFDLDHHLKQAALPAADEQALRAVVGELMSRQLDLSRPLWDFHLVEDYGPGCALVGRVHHCLADGPALMHVLLTLTDTSASGADAPAPPASSAPARGAVAQLTELLARQGVEILFNPFHLRRLARQGTEAMAALSKIMWRPPDPQTILRGRLSTQKRVAWSRPVALAEAKTVGRSVGGTVNDVMLAAATGALRRYLESHGQPVQGLTIRAGLSVNLRAREARPSLGNQAGAVLVDLPIGLDSPLARLRQVKRQMDGIKRSPEASLVWGLLQALGRAPAEVQAALVETYLNRDTAVMANVPGPEKAVYLDGAHLSTCMFWVPALGGAGLGLSVVSYAGQLWFGVGTDQGLVPDPEEIVAGFQAEFEALWHSKQGLGPDRDGSVQAMSTRLDDALAQLDALLEAAAEEGPG